MHQGLGQSLPRAVVCWGLCVEQRPSPESGQQGAQAAQLVGPGQLHAEGPGGRVTWRVKCNTDCAESLGVEGRRPPAGDVEGPPLRVQPRLAPRSPGKELALGSAGRKVSGGARVEPLPLLPADTACLQALVSLRMMLAVTKKKQEKAQSSTKPTQKVWRKGDLCLLTAP